MKTLASVTTLAIVATTAVIASGQAPPQPSDVVPRQDAPTPGDGPLASMKGPGKSWTIPSVAARAAEVAPDLEVARARVAGAEAASSEAWANALPRLTLTARYSYVGMEDNDPLITPGGDLNALRARAGQIVDPAARDVAIAQIDGLIDLSRTRIAIPRHQVAFNATLSYPVTPLFTEILPGIEAAEIGEEARRHELDAARADVRLLAVEWLMNHARAKASFAVAKRRVARAERDVEAAEARLDAEVGTLPDVLRFRALVAEAQRELVAREATVIATAAGLRALLDLDGTGPVSVDVPITAIPPTGPTPAPLDLVAAAQSRRPEVLALEAWAASTERSATAASGAAWPALSVALGADYARPNTVYSPPTDRFRPSWTASAMLTWSPDGAWAASRRARRIDAEGAVVRKQRAVLLDGVRVEVETTLAEYRAAVAGMRAAREQVAAANEAYAARRRAYELGATTVTELLAAELDAHRATLALVDAGADARIRRARLRRALGDSIAG